MKKKKEKGMKSIYILNIYIDIDRFKIQIRIQNSICIFFLYFIQNTNRILNSI